MVKCFGLFASFCARISGKKGHAWLLKDKQARNVRNHHRCKLCFKGARYFSSLSSAKAEVGAGTHGIWASRAAKAFLRHAPPWASCELLLVEPFVMGDGSALRTHVQKNFPENRCKFQVFWPHDKLLQHGLKISSATYLMS